MKPEDWTAWQDFAATTLLNFALNLLGAVVILVVGWWVAGWASRAAGRATERVTRLDPTLKSLSVALVRYVILVITLLAVLGRFGVQTASIIAVLGAAGLAIGLALQGMLSNVAAGVVLLVLRPFKVGDSVTLCGHSGTVTMLGLFATELNTPDQIFVSLPNSSVWNSPIINFTRNPTRRFDLTVGIAYEDDVDKAIGITLRVLKDHELVLEEPEPMVAVRELADSSVNLVVRGFATTKDYWSTVFDIQKIIKQRFDAEGITIPYPQRTVHTVVAGAAQ